MGTLTQKLGGSIILEFAFFMILVATVLYGGFLSVSHVSNQELARTLIKRLFYDGANYWTD
jgi:hypothetical protein